MSAGRTPPGNRFVPKPNRRPETSQNVEFGAKLRLADTLRPGDRLRMRVTACRSEIDDVIEAVVLRTTTVACNVTAATPQADNRDTNQPLAALPDGRDPNRARSGVGPGTAKA